MNPVREKTIVTGDRKAKPQRTNDRIRCYRITTFNYALLYTSASVRLSATTCRQLYRTQKDLMQAIALILRTRLRGMPLNRAGSSNGFQPGLKCDLRKLIYLTARQTLETVELQ